MGRDLGSKRLLPVLTLLLLMLAAACGGEEPRDSAGGQPQETDTTAEGETTPEGGEGEDDQPAEPATLSVIFPINTPILHGFRVAQVAGYYEDEGIDVEFDFLDGGGEVITQLLADNADLGIVPVGNVVEAIGQGSTDLRAIWNAVYGSIFFIATPSDSDITSAVDLEGRNLGVSSLSGGEMPVVRGIIRSAGLTEQQVQLTPIGEGTALAVQALQNGDVDGFGGSINDMIALQVQGLDLRFILPDELTRLPASGVVAKQATIDQKRDAIERFLRATTKGYHWARVNPEAARAALEEATPEQFAEETGELIFEAVRPLTWSPEGVPMGFQSADTWRDFFEFVGVDVPDVPLDEIVIEDFIEPANDYDAGTIEQDANSYVEGS